MDLDQTAVDLILDALKSNRDSVDKLRDEIGKNRDEVSKIASCIVGQDKCVEMMGKLNSQIQDVKMVCTRNETGKDAIAKDHEDLVKRVDKIEKEKIDDDLVPRIRCLEDRKIVVDYQQGLIDVGWKTITGSKVLGSFFLTLCLIVTGIYWPYFLELVNILGPYITLAVVCSAVFILYALWKSRRKIADAGRGLAWVG